MASLPDHLKPNTVGKEQLSKEIREEHQRNRVLAAVAEVFAKRGYHATTVDHLVAAAKIGVGSFYALCDGKEECFLSLYDGIVSEVEERIVAAVPEGAPWADRMVSGIRELLTYVAAESQRARIVLAEAHTAGPAAESRYAATLERIAALLREGRSAETGDEALRPSSEDATVAGVAWLLNQRLAVGDPIEVAELLPEVSKIVIEPYIGRAEAERLIA